MDKKRLLYYEAFIAIILSFIGGIFDVYCLFNFNIYAMLHTGNVIKLVTSLIDGDYTVFLATLSIVLAFAVGIYLANVYGHHRKDKSNKGLLFISILLLLAAAFAACLYDRSHHPSGTKGREIIRDYARFGMI